MSLQVTAGYGSLLAVGMGQSPEIETYFELLDQDEMDILRRRGLIDVVRFNKRWGSEMSLLMIDKPTTIKGDAAEKNLEKFGAFTAVMVSIVAVLDAFALPEMVQITIRQVLLELLRTSDFGEDILASQYSHRIKAWRSSAILRGLTSEAKRIRKELLSQDAIVEGLIPNDEISHMVNFLVWLISENSDTYTTPSSDVAGVAECLSQLSIEIISIEGLIKPSTMAPCRLKYSPNAAILMPGREHTSDNNFFRTRVPYTTVSIQNPEESLAKFPVDAETANRCRDAWVQGQKAARFVACRPIIPKVTSKDDDFKYVFYDIGSKPTRARPGIHQLASAHAFVMNKELCSAVELTFQHESAQVIEWLLDQTIESPVTDSQIWNIKMQDVTKINAFTVFHAFFMGYYYEIFLPLVDTSTLKLQVVDGAWGFRSPAFLCNMRTIYVSLDTSQEPGIRILRREDVLSILATMILGTGTIITRIKKSAFSKDNWCLGVVKNRALLVRSLISPCRTLREIRSFVLLDVDVSGIPVNIEGLVHPGALPRRSPWLLDISGQFRETWNAMSIRFEGTLTQDVTLHIEADWDGDPETIFLCVHYKGRRIEVINPATADITFLRCLVPPVSSPLRLSNESGQDINETTHWTATDLLNNRVPICPPADSHPKPLLMSLAGRPRLRYYAAEYYNREGIVRIATNCVDTAAQQLSNTNTNVNSRLFVIISGTEAAFTPSIDDWIPTHIQDRIEKFGAKNQMTKRLLGDWD